MPGLVVTTHHRRAQFLAALAIAVLVAGCVVSSREMVRSGAVEPADFDLVVPFMQVMDTVVVEAELDGEEGRFLLDTGSNITVVDRLPISGNVIDVGGAARAEESMATTRLSSFGIGTLRFTDTYAASGNLQQLGRAIPGFRGLIGQPILSKANWFLDYRLGEARISSEVHATPGMTEVPVHYRLGLPHLVVDIDGTTVEVLLDSGATTYLVLPASSAFAQSLAERYAFTESQRKLFRIGGSDTVMQLVGVVPRVVVGDRVLHDVTVEIRDTSRPRLGARFLADQEQVLLVGGGNLWLAQGGSP